MRSALLAVHERVLPEIEHRSPERRARRATTRASSTASTRGTRTYTADEWVALIATYSVNQTLEPSRLAELQRELHAAITAHGGTVVVHGSTDVSWSRAAPR